MALREATKDPVRRRELESEGRVLGRQLQRRVRLHVLHVVRDGEGRREIVLAKTTLETGDRNVQREGDVIGRLLHRVLGVRVGHLCHHLVNCLFRCVAIREELVDGVQNLLDRAFLQDQKGVVEREREASERGRQTDLQLRLQRVESDARLVVLSVLHHDKRLGCENERVEQNAARSRLQTQRVRPDFAARRESFVTRQQKRDVGEEEVETRSRRVVRRSRFTGFLLVLVERRQKRSSRDRVDKLHDKGETRDSVGRTQRHSDVGGVAGVEGRCGGVQSEGDDELRRLARVVVDDGLYSWRELRQLARRGREAELELVG